MKTFYFIINEKIYGDKNFYFCENKDISSIINYFSSKYNLFIISRYSNFIKPFKLNKVYKIFNLRLIRIFYLFRFILKINKKEKKILIISITPFNFLIFYLFKYFFDCKFYLYLRSNGHEEYENILGKRYIWIYDFMYRYITKYSEIISCHKRLYNNKCHILHPSELNINWTKKIKKNYFKNNIINILYVGRFKIEKGIYSLLSLFSKLPENYRLTLVGNGDPIKITDNRVKVVNFINIEKKLIDLYDHSNIVILPSYTEAHPKVIDESLSRMRPVVVFDNIKHVINNRFGVFSVKRDVAQLKKIINFIVINHQLINNQMKKNHLPKRNDFLKNLSKIISKD